MATVRVEPAQTVRPDRCRITVQGPDGGEAAFDLRRNDLLLKAAIEQGIEYPHNCRVGVCGSCKTQVLSGRVSPMVDLALSPLSNAEIEAGFVLACQAKVRTPLRIAVKLGTHALLPVVTVPSRVVGWTRLPGEVVQLRVALETPVRFKAGQYFTLAESGSFVRRHFSCAEPPPVDGAATTELAFLIKRLPGGAFSEWLFAADRSGTKLWLEGPYGRMAVDDLDRDAICIAGGTGLAPVLSIVGDRLRRSASARFTIVFGVRTAADDFAAPMLARLAEQAPDRVRVVTLLSHEPPGSAWAGRRGWVTEALDDALGLDWTSISAFACGHPGMVEAVERRLLALGVDPDRIHADRFLPSG